MTAQKREHDNEPDKGAEDSSEHKRPKKATLVHDPVFYRDDGDCVIQVEDCLFKIHKYHLLRGTRSKFQEMLKTQPTDSRPILLAGDTLAQFRAFLSYAYEDPCLSRTRVYAPVHLRTIVDAGLFSHKYDIDPSKNLSLVLILQLFRDFRFPAQPFLFTDILKLVASPTHPVAVQIHNVVQAAWISGLSQQHTNEFLRDTLNAATQFNCRQLLGRAYYTYLVHIEHSASAPPAGTADPARPLSLLRVPVFPNPDGLTAEHTLRILTGHWSLTQLWQRLTRKVPVLRRGPHAQCDEEGHATECKAEWEEAWLEAAASRGVGAVHPSDVLGRLAALHVELGSVYAERSVQCGVNSASIVPNMMSQVDATLADHFLGPPTTPVGG